jgi:O-antigen ligase
MELWQNAFQIYLKKPQGTGPGNEPLAYSAYSQTRALESHTVFLSVLVEYNIIGLAIFMAGFSALGMAVLHIKDPALRCAAGMIFVYCFLIALATSILETRFFWQPVMLVMMIIEIDFRTRQSQLVGYEGETMESFETLYENQMV